MTTETKPVQVLARIDPQALLSVAVEKGAGVDTLERLVTLAKTVRDEQARSAWYEAMSEFQRRCPEITKTKKADIVTAKGFYSYKYAPLDEIMASIRPLLGELGLSVFWSSPSQSPAGHVVTSCRVAHVLGHVEESGQVSLPIPDSSERGGGNPLQRIGSALSYARRYSLMSIMGISPEDDDDANSEGRSSTESSPPKEPTFPFPDELKGQPPSACDLATLHQYLPVFEKAAADPKNKYREQNERLVVAIKEAIAKKTAKVETPAPEPPPDTHAEKMKVLLDQAWAKVDELCQAVGWNNKMLRDHCSATFPGTKHRRDLNADQVSHLVEYLQKLVARREADKGKTTDNG